MHKVDNRGSVSGNSRAQRSVVTCALSARARAVPWTNTMEMRVPGSVAESPHAAEGRSFALWVTPPMRAIQSLMADLASTDIPILVTGEAGTGKEVVARQIHELSPRRTEPFVRLRCSGLIPEELDRVLPDSQNGRGRSDGSGRATVLLDEISELNSACQNKLLQTLSSQDGVAKGRLSACVVSTTRQALEHEIREGRFHEELYYRLSGVSLRLPPLRQRCEDVPVLAEFLLTKYATLFGKPRPAFSPLALRLLQSYAWPGNIRELENTVKKVVALGDEKIALADLESSISKSLAQGVVTEGYSLKQAARAASRQAERELILKVLARTRWNRKRAAQELQISYKALLYKLKQIGFDDSAA